MLFWLSFLKVFSSFVQYSVVSSWFNIGTIEESDWVDQTEWLGSKFFMQIPEAPSKSFQVLAGTFA